MAHELCGHCGGEGSFGTYKDGTPQVCTHCNGDGFEPSQLERIADQDPEPSAEETYGADDGEFWKTAQREAFE